MRLVAAAALVVLVVGARGVDGHPARPRPRPPVSSELAASTGRPCAEVTPLAGHDPEALATLMREHQLKPLAVRVIDLGRQVDVGDNRITTVTVGGVALTGIASTEIACAKPDARFGVDAQGAVFQIAPPSWRIDYTAGTCVTPTGTRQCETHGSTHRFYVLPDRQLRYGGYLPAPEPRTAQLAR